MEERHRRELMEYCRSKGDPNVPHIQELLERFPLATETLGPIVEDLCLSSSGYINLERLGWILSLNPLAISSHMCVDDRTILHGAVDPEEDLLHRPDMVQTLVQHCPDLRHQRDQYGDLAIDHLARRILMRLENLKYHRSQPSSTPNNTTDDQELQNMWLCAEHLIRRDHSVPFLHSILTHVREIPMSLVSHALQRYQDQLLQADPHSGNLPIHCLVASTPPQDDDEDTFLPLLGMILSRQPSAASKCNHQHLYPIDLAIQTGRCWDNGLSLLLRYYPSGSTFVNLPKSHLSIYLQALLRRQQMSAVYLLLRPHMDELGPFV